MLHAIYLHHFCGLDETPQKQDNDRFFVVDSGSKAKGRKAGGDPRKESFVTPTLDIYTSDEEVGQS
jgi:hypothetical protein